MFETHINYLAVLAATLASFGFGAVWYMSLSKRWLAAVERTPEEVKAVGRPAWLPFALSLALEFVMAYILARTIEAVGAADLSGGLLTGFAAAVGFALPVTAINYIYPARKAALTLIDGGHWLGVLLIQGAVIGLIG
jgi:hypothetical protein